MNSAAGRAAGSFMARWQKGVEIEDDRRILTTCLVDPEHLSIRYQSLAQQPVEETCSAGGVVCGGSVSNEMTFLFIKPAMPDLAGKMQGLMTMGGPMIRVRGHDPQQQGHNQSADTPRTGFQVVPSEH